MPFSSSVDKFVETTFLPIRRLIVMEESKLPSVEYFKELETFFGSAEVDPEQTSVSYSLTRDGRPLLVCTRLRISS